MTQHAQRSMERDWTKIIPLSDAQVRKTIPEHNASQFFFAQLKHESTGDPPSRRLVIRPRRSKHIGFEGKMSIWYLPNWTSSEEKCQDWISEFATTYLHMKCLAGGRSWQEIDRRSSRIDVEKVHFPYLVAVNTMNYMVSCKHILNIHEVPVFSRMYGNLVDPTSWPNGWARR